MREPAEGLPSIIRGHHTGFYRPITIQIKEGEATGWQGGNYMTYFGIALVFLGILALAGIIYVQLDKKHLRDKSH